MLLDKKFEYWKKQLLDLGKRNRMINYRESKRATLKLIEPEFEALFKRLAVDEEELLFQSPIDKNSDIRIYSVLSLMESLSCPIPVTIGDIKTEGSIFERQKTLHQMRLKSRLALDEQGTNILYMVSGFIEWREKRSDSSWIRSPLVLVPVSLMRDSLNAPYILKKYDEDIVVNPTLSYLFERDYGISLPSFDADEETITDFMNKMEALVDRNGWRIVRENSIGLVSFLKINMYTDLCNNEEEIKNNPIIRAFAKDTSLLQTIPKELYHFDHDQIPAIENYQVVNADSSQQDAILLSQKGISFVLQGPPGTGKSQTITNIIAQGLADGKKILFVSEKAAALEVVYKRLSEVHLDDFCMALHSYKANKKEVLENLERSLQLQPIRVKSEEIEKLTELDTLKEFLKTYVTDIHEEKLPLGMSLYEVFGELQDLEAAIALPFELEKIDEISKDQVNRLGLLVMDYDKAKGKLGDTWDKNPWNGTIIANVNYDLLNQIKETFQRVVNRTQEVVQGVEQIYSLYDEKIHISLKNLERYQKWMQIMVACKDVPFDWIDKDELLYQVKQEAECLEKQNFTAARNRDLLGTVFDQDFFRIDAEKKAAKIKKLMFTIKNGLKKENTSWNAYLADVKNQKETICHLYELFNKAINEMNDISEELKIGVPVTIADLFARYRVASLLNKKHMVAKEWFEKNVDDLVKVIDNYEKTSALLEVQKKELAQKGSMVILETDYYAQLVSITNLIVKLENYEILKKLTLDELKSYVKTIEKNKEEILKVYNEINGEVAGKISSVLTIPKSLPEIDSCIQVLGLLVRNVMPGEKWYILDDHAEFESYKDSCVEKQKRYRQLKNEIALNWEKGIYQLDHNALLHRFKVEYNSIFKAFKSSYRKDVKLLRGLYHAANNRFKNQDVIVETLNKIVEIEELEQWFLRNEEQLKKYFGGKFRGLETDFGEIIEDRNAFKTCYSLPGIGSKLLLYIKKYCNDDKMYFLLMIDLLQELKNFIESGHVSKLYQQNLFLEAIDAHRELIDIINHAIKTYEEAEDYIFNAEDITVNDFVNFVEKLSELESIQNEEKTAFCSLTETFGYDSSFDTSKLCVLREGLSAVGELKTMWTSIPNTIQELMVLGLDIKGILYTEEDVQSTVKELCEKLQVIYSKEWDIKTLRESVEKQLRCCDELQGESESVLRYCKTNTEDVDVPECLALLCEEQNYYLRITEMDTRYKEQFGSLYKGKNTNWSDIISEVDKTSLLKAYIQDMKCSKDFVKQLLANHLKKIDLKKIEKDIENLRGCETEYKWICSLFDETTDFMQQELKHTYERWKNCLEQLPTLDAWIDYRECRKKCCENGLEKFVVGAEDLHGKEGTLIHSFRKMFYLKWMKAECAKIESVSQFRRRVQIGKIERFCDLDAHQLLVAQMRIREKLIADMPDRNQFNRATDEMGILIHELSKKRKIMPLRKLFGTIPNLLLKIKPCMMMSPLSVSYFLEAKTYQFDMVIFDEASQIFPQDAIGAIFRGKQVIIAGDSKQLPPTNFFASSTNNVDEYDIDDEDDVIYDSILEEATNSLPNRFLLWHYRSRNEDLIAFSNQKIYQNNLITFPSSNGIEADSGVQYIYVENGVYAGRCNIQEAKRCVEIVKEQILKHPDRSLGIIAFSEKQQAAIEEEIQRFREKNPMYEHFFSEQKEEPFFIKNLENVQGDERDTIIFSICYAKDINGRMYMRFGPLGHQGGERRLNVAITRAKMNIKLVGSIMPDEIDLKQTKSEGVKMLRDYIAFAMKGSIILQSHQNLNALHHTDVFCDCIYAFLRKNGYTVKQYVGNSNYKIDIAVEHPDNPGCFVAGIECDGNSYLSARTIRDREHLRSSVLEHMGWNMFRVWSVEWTNNRESEQQRLLDFIHNAIRASVESTQKEEAALPETSDFVQVELIRRKERGPCKLQLPYYREGNWRIAKRNLYDPKEGDLNNLASRIRVVVEVEQPIHLDLLYRRLASAFGNEKVTKVVRDNVNLAIRQVMSKEVVIEDGFVRFSDFTDIKARIPRGIQERNIEYISKPEIADAMVKVIENSYGIAKDDLCSEVSRLFGYERMGPKISQAMNDTIEYMIANKIVSMIDGKMHVRKV